MNLPGEWTRNPLFFGSWSRKPVGNWRKADPPWTWEIGIAVKLPADRFPLGEEVTLQLDGRAFRGRVVEAHADQGWVSTGLIKFTAVTLEGRYQ